MVDAGDSVSIHDNRVGFSPRFRGPARLPDDGHQAIAQRLRATPYVMTTASQIRRLRDGVVQKQHALWIVVVID
jgi:hypothetical protein